MLMIEKRLWKHNFIRIMYMYGEYVGTTYTEHIKYPTIMCQYSYNGRTRKYVCNYELLVPKDSKQCYDRNIKDMRVTAIVCIRGPAAFVALSKIRDEGSETAIYRGDATAIEEIFGGRK